jgi:DNA-binding GntR family transcriptional regulator
MPYEYTPPKYAQVIEELRRRIESGEYPPGSLLPSEHQLSEEFQIARPTVVRALRVLRQDGWIETQQGKGSFVRGRPALAGLESERPGEQALNRDESREPGELAGTGMSVPPPRVAALLGAPADTKVPYRRLLLRRDGEASERKGIRIDHVIEQVVARHPTAQEAKLLGVTRTAPMLAMYVAARDASGEPVLVLELVMPGDRHEFEDAYQVG